MPFICVIFYDAGNEDNVPFPILTAGIFDYGAGQPVGRKWDYWYARWHVRMPDRRDNGNVMTVKSQKQWPTWNLPFQSVSTFAVPLVEVTNADDLDSKLVKPLIELVEGNTKATG